MAANCIFICTLAFGLITKCNFVSRRERLPSEPVKFEQGVML